MKIKEAIRRSLRNIISYGDTDIFPFPFERYLFDDKFSDCAAHVSDIDKCFDSHLASHPPLTIDNLTQIGYTGFRRATQIEPFWNAYYLALTISMAEEIESKRIPVEKGTVYSYRYAWDDTNSSLFGDSTWSDYRKRAYELSRDAKVVVLTDIADFYPRVSHHRLENALNRIFQGGSPAHRVLELLKHFTQTRSYGLPIGGPASRILAELALNDTDIYLSRRGVSFCRYADDYSLFCDTKADAYQLLVQLSERLFNEGLSLQKSKTRILSASEFSQIHAFLDPKPVDDLGASEEQKLLNLSIKFDPYSPTAEEEYDTLKAAVKQIDILGILSNEIGKSTIDPIVTKQAISALRVLDIDVQYHALRILLDPNNLLSLSPVFVQVMRAVRGIYDELSDDGKDGVDDALLSLYEGNDHLLSLELNLSYYVQAMSRRRDERKEEVLIQIFDVTTSHLLHRQIIQIMAAWGCEYWISDVKRSFNSYTLWERRAILMGSYCLGDEGRHWRQHIMNTLSPAEKLIKQWSSDRHQANKPIPA